MRIEPLAVPSGAGVLDVLPRLAAALEGGRPVAPYAAGSPPPDLAATEAAGLPDGLAAWRAPADQDRALSAIVGAAARVLVTRPDAPIPFCHAVTAPAATRLILPSLAPEVAARTVHVSWRVTGSLVAAFGHPHDPREATTPVVTSSEVARLVDRLPAAAVEHGDEHVIKLSEAALREYAVSQDPSVLVAADRFRSRVPATHL